MVLLDEFDSTRTAILNRKLLPSIDTALKDLISEETRKHITSSRSANMILTIVRQTNSTSRPPISFASKSTIECRYRQQLVHFISECHKLQFRNRGQGQRT